MSDPIRAMDVNMKLFDSPEEAPVYRAPEYLLANITDACIVGRGTVEGNPTVDFLFEDVATGQKYMAMLSGGLVEGIAAAVRGMRDRTKGT